MADPICRWRNPYVKTVREFITQLPKSEMSSDNFRIAMSESTYGSDFFRTPYQLACQLGLYIEEDDKYIPRFKHNPTIVEVNAYLRNWLKFYPVPNPYTKKGFENLVPKSVHSEICHYLFEKKASIDWGTIKSLLFIEEIGNDDILVNTINSYSDVIEIVKGNVQLKADVIYDDLKEFVVSNELIDRNDKVTFFDLFQDRETLKSKSESRKVTSNVSRKIIQESNSIRDFALFVFKYFYDEKWQEILNISSNKVAKINDTDFVSYDFDLFERLIAEFPSEQSKEQLTSSGTKRYFETPILVDGPKYFYFTTQWNGGDEYSLSFKNLKQYFETHFKDYKIEKEADTYKLIHMTQKTQTPFDYKIFIKDLKEVGLVFPDEIVLRFISSLLAKPFAILTGLSGSGKTKLVQAFSKWICESENQICIVPVGADWTNREPLLGYPNALSSGNYVLPENGALKLMLEASKSENQNRPYFLILDEMNLSHVERYFADFLSTMESSEAISLRPEMEWKDTVPSSIKLPKNLFIVGTVNIDETTYMFSPKVLDRANVIEFRVTSNQMETYLKHANNINLDKLNHLGAGTEVDFVTIAKNRDITLNNATTINQNLIKFFDELKKTGAEFGYRSASEILRFSAIAAKLESSWSTEQILDAAVMQKLLPKVHGSRRKLEPVLKTLASLCVKESIKTVADFKIDALLLSENQKEINDKLVLPVSFEKISRMYKGLLDNGFTSYAEA
jgi:hypothetical protein